MKKRIKDILRKFRNIKLWIKTVLLTHNKAKLSIKDRFLALKNGFASDWYVMLNLNKNNINDYLSDYDRYLTREIDGEYKYILDNKILFTNYFKDYVTVPKIFCIILNDIYDKDGKIISNVQIEKILSNKKSIIKPINDGGGTGVHIIENKNNEWFWDFKKECFEKIIDIIQKNKNSLICEYVIQHDYSKKIFPDSVNTIRIITIHNPETKKCSIPFAVHRFGNSNTGCVDNASRGGYITKIDIKTGKLCETKSFADTNSIDVHPDTNIRIKDTVIPNWNFVKKDLLKIAQKMPYMPFIAWDVVITEKGYSIIEANASSGFGIIQLFGSFKNTELWDFYKYYGIKRTKK